MNEKEKTQRIAWLILATVITALSIFLGVTFPVPPAAEDTQIVELGTTHFTNLQAEDVISTDDVTVGDDLSVTDDATISDDLTADVITATGDLVGSSDLRFVAQTSITATNGNPITATGTYQPLTAAGTVTPTLAVGTAGDLLVLINAGSNNIVFEDAGTLKLTNDPITLGQYDSLTLWCDGTNWIQVSSANN